MTTELKPCPFCKVDLQINPRSRISFGHTDDCYLAHSAVDLDDQRQVTKWNTRATPDVPELVRYMVYNRGISKHPEGQYVSYDQAAEMIAAKDTEIEVWKENYASSNKQRNKADGEVLKLEERLNAEQFSHEQSGKARDEWQRRAEAAEAKLAQIKEQLTQAQAVHRWSVDDDGNGALYVCRDNHDKGEPCEWEKFIPASTAPVANEAETIERLREAFKQGWQHSNTEHVEDGWEDTFAYLYTDEKELRALSGKEPS